MIKRPAWYWETGKNYLWERIYSGYYAGLIGKETMIDAYCRTGTIGLAAKQAERVIGIELNPDAVRDARVNAKDNQITNVRFLQGDAGEYMVQMAEQGQKVDVVFMDPPRAGSDRKF